MLLTGAQIMVRCLEEEGVTTAFGYPGGAILPFYDALQESSQIEHILTVHEQGAAHAAEGYARACGKVGVCIATSGPGATNLITGLASAFLDSIPLVAITGQVPLSLIGRDAFQEVDITGISMPITKHNILVKDPAQLADSIRLAFDIARADRPGPVLIDIPRDLQAMKIDFKEKVKKCDCQIKTPCPEKIEKAVNALKNAKRPVLLVGGGAVATGVQKEIIELAEKINMPVTSTLMGIGAFPSSHPLFLGMSGLHGLEKSNNAIHGADVLLAVGSRFNDRVTGDRKVYADMKTVIHIDVDPAEIDKNVFAGIGLAGDMKESLKAITEKINGRTPQLWWDTIEDWPDIEDSIRGSDAPLFVKAINDAVEGKEVVFVTDVGQHQMWAAQHLNIEKPRQWITSGGLGAMGFGTPAALGAQFARPDARVICISGDGGFKMTGNELYTIRRNNLPVINIIFNNEGLGMIRQLQQVMFDNRFTACTQPSVLNFKMYANAFGIEADQVDTVEGLRIALNNALDQNEPRLIEVTIRKTDMVKPMVNIGAGLNSYVKFPLPPT